MTAPIVPGVAVSSWVISRVRTGIPMAVGVALTFAEHQWGWWPRGLDTATVTPLAVFGVSYGYYELVRWLERWKPALGWLLGYPAQPHYGGEPHV